MIAVARTSNYTTLENKVIALNTLSWVERAFYDRLHTYYKTSPSHEDFSFYWRSEGEEIWANKPRKEVSRSPIFAICQDLDARLAIKEGHVAPPEPRKK